MTLPDGEVLQPVDFPTVGPGGRRYVARRFARRLVSGPASLYELAVPPGERAADRFYDGGRLYYLRVGDGPIHELVRGKLSRRGADRPVDSYLSTLGYLLAGCPDLDRRLGRRGVGYYAAALRRVVLAYNACHGAAPEFDALAPKPGLEFAAWVRAGYILERYLDVPGRRSVLDFPDARGLVAGAVFEMRTPRLTGRRIGWRVGAEYIRYTAGVTRLESWPQTIEVCLSPTVPCYDLVTSRQVEVEVPVSLITVPITVRSTFRGEDKDFRPFVEGGGTVTWIGPSGAVSPGMRLAVGATFGPGEASATQGRGLQFGGAFRFWRSRARAGGGAGGAARR